MRLVHGCLVSVALTFVVTGVARSQHTSHWVDLASSDSDAELMPVPDAQMNDIDHASQDGEPLWENENFDESGEYGEYEEPYGFPTSPSLGGHWSVRTDAMLMWVHGMRLPALVTTSPTGTAQASAGVLGENFVETPTASILFGKDRQTDNTFSPGGRISLGWWVDELETFGIVGNYFRVESDSFEFNASSDGLTGSQILARPFFNVQPTAGSARQDSSLLAFPDVWSGNISIRGKSEVFGSEVYLQENLFNGFNTRWDLIYGYPYLQVNEELLIQDSIVAGNPGPGGGVQVGTQIDSFDLFDTENVFHGGQLGLHWEQKHRIWIWESSMKLALGSMQERVLINGGATTTVPGPPVTSSNSSGGLLALPTNIGTRRDSQFAVIPEFSFGLKCQWTPRLEWSVGYNFLYMSHLVRPGDQMDLNVNPTQIGGGTLTGDASPSFNFVDTDFWTQGITLGLEYRH